LVGKLCVRLSHHSGLLSLPLSLLMAEMRLPLLLLLLLLLLLRCDAAVAAC
jgi:hypothetical protein